MTGARALALQHVAFEGLGRLGPILHDLKIQVDICKPFSGDTVPKRLEGIDLLVVLGGSMSAEDVQDFPWLADERDLISLAIEHNVGVIGICLGAQLLALAGGGEVFPNTLGVPPSVHREVGWGPVSFRPDPNDLELLAGLNPAENVVHWHGDTFSLPDQAVLLASTLACRNQMFRLGNRAFGLQFHLEYTEDSVETMIAEDRDYLLAAGGVEAVARLRADTQAFMDRYEQVGRTLLHSLLRRCLA